MGLEFRTSNSESIRIPNILGTCFQMVKTRWLPFCAVLCVVFFSNIHDQVVSTSAFLVFFHGFSFRGVYSYGVNIFTSSPWYYVIVDQKNTSIQAAMTALNSFPSFLTHCFFVSNKFMFNSHMLFHLLLAKNVREENWKLLFTKNFTPSFLCFEQFGFCPMK